MVKDLAQIQRILHQELPRLAQQYGVASLALFGSRVRHEAHLESDLDVLVRFHRAPGLLRFVELENDLSDLLGLRVDLVMADALRSRIGQRILEEAVPI